MPRVTMVLLPLLAGCYAYVPLPTAELQPGAGVRLRITAQTAADIEPLLGRADARVLSGVVIAAGDPLIVEVPTTAQLAGSGTAQRLHQRVSIPRASLLEVEGRTLDRTRTAIATGVGAVLAGLIIYNATVEKPGNVGPPGGGGPAELRPR